LRLKKQKEELIRMKDVAEAANRAKSTFLASMSHELRTPLNAIIGFSQILQKKYFGQLNEKQEEYVKDILDSGRHLLSLINDILDLAKVEAGKMELQPSAFNMKELLEHSVIMIREKATKHGINLVLKVPDEIGDIDFIADERKLKQVMMNLLSNASKFTPDGGEISVEAVVENGSIKISVTDTGLGIAKDELNKVFEKFYQSSSGKGSKSVGTGLGLPLTKKFIEMHGGTIGAKSEGEGKGSCFWFTIPIKKEDTE